MMTVQHLTVLHWMICTIICLHSSNFTRFYKSALQYSLYVGMSPSHGKYGSKVSSLGNYAQHKLDMSFLMHINICVCWHWWWPSGYCMYIIDTGRFASSNYRIFFIYAYILQNTTVFQLHLLCIMSLFSTLLFTQLLWLHSFSLSALLLSKKLGPQIDDNHYPLRADNIHVIPT